MGVRYICDAEGRKTGVIVPIGLWDSLNPEKPAGERVGVPDPGRYRGIYRDLNVDLKAEIRNLRDETPRRGHCSHRSGSRMCTGHPK